MIHWREKFRAFGIHFAITAIVAGAAGALIFGVWFPDPFDAIAGGARLFLLVASCDLVLGPLLSIVVYDSRKTRRHLVLDYTVIGIVQLAALFYGVSVVSGARPSYVVFVADRLEIVAAQDLKPAELAAARDPEYARVPLFGVQFVGVQVPPQERNEALTESLQGNEEAGRPRFYVPYEQSLPQIRAHALAVAELLKRHPEAASSIEEGRADAGIPDERLRWLPLRYKTVFWTALIDIDTGKPVEYVELDPY